MDALFDRTGRQIMVGDVLKIFHFFGPRRMRFYMHKHVVELVKLGEGKKNFFKISHLNNRPEFYHERIDGRQLRTHEIVQGYGEDGTPFYDRLKHLATLPEWEHVPMPTPGE